MSQSPDVDSSQDDLDQYLNNWRAVNLMVRHGSSLSGRERHCVYLNTGAERFANVSSATGLDFPDDGRGMASVDWDSDGDLDLWFYNRTSPRLRLMLNQSGPDARSVSFLLRGKTCNRDAIGARVEIKVPGQTQPHLATLYAGDGFVSQSSKWMHFGLGGADAIESVTVRWPDGAVESFTGAEPGGKFILEQSSGSAERWTRPGDGVRLDAKPAPQFRPTQAARVYLPVRFPQPIFEYTSLDESQKKTVEHGGRPRLVNFWASWCAPCVAELSEMSAREKELRKTGLDIVALSVDGFGEIETTAADARAKIAELDFPFEHGLVTLELLDKLDMIEGFLFDRIEQFVVPVSYLFDKDGKLAVIYRGPVDVDQLMRDVKTLDSTIEENHARAVPFAGEWRKTFDDYSLAGVARWFSGLYPEDTARFMEMSRAELAAAGVESDGPQSTLLLARSLLEQGQTAEGEAELQRLLSKYPNYVEGHNALGEHLMKTGRIEPAIAAFEKAIQIAPDFSTPYFQLGVIYGGLRQPAKSVPYFERFVELAPESAVGHNNLGSALRAGGDTNRALQEFQLAAQLDPAYAGAQINLGRVHNSAGRPALAIEHFEKALAIDATSLDAVRPLVWILATNRDANVRNGMRAVELSEAAFAQTAGRDMGIVAGLAVSYAEAGRFEEAVAKARDALALAQSAGNANAVRSCQQWIQLFSNSQPYRE